MSPSQEGGISPFQTMQARCIVCEKEATFSKLKTTLYSETKRDIDLRPITVLWSKKVSPRVDPKLFYFWQCPYCFFTADHIFYQHPFKDGNMSTTRFRKQFHQGRDAQPAYKDVCRLLLFDANQEKSVFISGLKLNMLACYQWELVDEVVKGEAMQLASYYLRMAWMLHDLRHSLTKSPAVKAEAQQLLSGLRTIWPQFTPSEAAMLQKALRLYQLALVKSAAIHTILHEVNLRLIIARILMKLSQLPEARKAIIECKARVKYYEGLIRKKHKEDGHFSASDLQDMETAHGKALALVSNVELIYDKIELTIQAREVQAAMKLLAQHPDQTYDEKLQVLRNASVSEAVIAKVLPREKRKGLIGMLKSS